MVESALTWKPDQILGTSKGIFIMFSDNITSLIGTETAAIILKKLVPFRVATAINRGCSTTYRIPEILEEKKEVGTWKLAVCTGALVKFPGAKMEVMQVDSSGRPHIGICMMILGSPRKLKTRVLVKLLSCTESGTNGTEVVRGRRR